MKYSELIKTAIIRLRPDGWIPIDEADAILKPGQTWRDAGYEQPEELKLSDGTILVKPIRLAPLAH